MRWAWHDPLIKNKHGRTVCMELAYRGHIIPYFNHDPLLRNADNSTAAMLAIIGGNIDIVRNELMYEEAADGRVCV